MNYYKDNQNNVFAYNDITEQMSLEQKIMENKMKYYINYTSEGKILGFAKGDTGLNIEVSNAIWFEAQSYNKIIIDGKNIAFEKVDWRTPKEIEGVRAQNINSYTKSIITTKYPLEKQSSANLGIYGEEYKTEMISFISNCVTLSNEAIDNGTSFEDYKSMLEGDE